MRKPRALKSDSGKIGTPDIRTTYQEIAMPEITETLAERGARYGVFAEHADIAQALQDAMRATGGWSKLAADQKQALTVIADKIARMLNGDPNYVDNWHDIIGYAKLVEDRLLGRGIYTPTPLHAVPDEPAECREFRRKQAVENAVRETFRRAYPSEPTNDVIVRAIIAGTIAADTSI
ncbi:TPA: hypothetical protein U2L32_002528 [Burkholderia cenocepacia]|nr:hypothetical protein [Burkholderia cenocepacia]